MQRQTSWGDSGFTSLGCKLIEFGFFNFQRRIFDGKQAISFWYRHLHKSFIRWLSIYRNNIFSLGWRTTDIVITIKIDNMFNNIRIYWLIFLVKIEGKASIPFVSRNSIAARAWCMVQLKKLTTVLRPHETGAIVSKRIFSLFELCLNKVCRPSISPLGIRHTQFWIMRSFRILILMNCRIAEYPHFCVRIIDLLLENLNVSP